MAIGDLLSGFAEAGHEYQTNLIQMAYKQRDTLASAYGRLMQDPSYPQEARTQFGQAFQDIMTSDPFKLPKVIKKYQDMKISVQPPGPPVSPPPNQPVDTTNTLGPSASPGDNMPVPPQPAPQQQSIYQPLSFAENLERQRQEKQMEFETSQAPLERLKLSKPVPTGNKGVEMDKDGNAFQVTQMRYLDPETGKWQMANQKSEYPLRKFAPRASGEINVEDAAKMQAEDPSWQFIDEGTGRPIDLQKIIATMPDATLRHTGSGQYQINSQKYSIGRFNNQVVPIPQVPPSGGPTASNVGQPLGVQRPDQTSVSWRSVGVDAQGFQIFEPFDSVRKVATGPRISVPPGQQPPQLSQPGSSTSPATGPAGAPVPPPGQPPAQPNAVPATGSPVVPTAPPQRKGGLATGVQEKTAEIMRSVRPAATILYGDANNPDFESLQSFAKIADDPVRRDLVGAAAKTIIQKLGRTGGGPTLGGSIAPEGIGVSGSLGSIVTLFTNYFGLPAKQAASEVGVVEDAMKPLNPEEVRMVGRIMAAYGTIVGLRKITSGGAYQFSTEAMEREIPIPGMTGVNSSQSYYNKLSQLGEELTKATKELPRNMVPEYPAWERNTAYLNAKGLGWGVAKLPSGDFLFKHEDGKWYDSKGKMTP